MELQQNMVIYTVTSFLYIYTGTLLSISNCRFFLSCMCVSQCDETGLNTMSTVTASASLSHLNVFNMKRLHCMNTNPPPAEEERRSLNLGDTRGCHQNIHFSPFF